jgi:hypothetical protein
MNHIDIYENIISSPLIKYEVKYMIKELYQLPLDKAQEFMKYANDLIAEKQSDNDFLHKSWNEGERDHSEECERIAF